MSQSPYAPPLNSNWSSGPPRSNNDAIKGQLLIVGIFFIILAMMGFVIGLFFGISGLLQMDSPQAHPPMNADENERMGFYIGYWGMTGGMLTSAVLQLLNGIAGICFIVQRGKFLCWVSSIAMIIPCLSPGCFLGVPFAIWAIVLLMRDDTAQLFNRA